MSQAVSKQPVVGIPSPTGAVALLNFLRDNGNKASLEQVEKFVKATAGLKADITGTDCKTDEGLAAKLGTFPFVEVTQSGRSSEYVVALVDEISRLGFTPEMYKRVEHKMIKVTSLVNRCDNIFVCTSCAKYIANKPVVAPCGHVACKRCAENYLSAEPGNCFGPMCPQQIALSDCLNISPRSKGVLLELWQLLAVILVKCAFEECHWKGPYDRYMLHAAVCPHQMGYTQFNFRMPEKVVEANMDSLERESRAHKILSTLGESMSAASDR